MKIIELRATNFARLRAIEIRPDGHIVPINGRNGQGKTSILNAVWAAFVGRAAAPPHAIRDGAEEARLHVAIGGDKVELAITRTVRRGKDGVEAWDLKVVQADGGRVTRKPQELIDHSLNALAFDPLAFARAKPPEQLAQLKALVPGFDFAASAAQRAKLFGERTDENRRASAQRSAANLIELPPGPEPKPVDTADLVRQLAEATEVNNRRTFLNSEAAKHLRDRDRLYDEAEKLRAQAVTLDRRATEAEVLANKITMPSAVDVAPLNAALASAQSVSQVAGRFAERRRAEAAADAAQHASDELTRRIDAIDVGVEDAIRKAKLPAGLSMTEEGVLLKGLPFEQAGTAEKILASAEVRMALAPDLRVMLIDEGSELDSSMLAALAKLADERDYQVWIARVDESGKSGFVIEDGRVSGQQAAAE